VAHFWTKTEPASGFADLNAFRVEVKRRELPSIFMPQLSALSTLECINPKTEVVLKRSRKMSLARAQVPLPKPLNEFNICMKETVDFSEFQKPSRREPFDKSSHFLTRGPYQTKQ
jgi:hypothetical protein